MSIFDQVAQALKGGSLVKEAVAAMRPAGVGKGEADTQAQREQWYSTSIRATQLIAQGGFAGYAQRNLKIQDKAGGLRPLTLNRAQLYVEAMAERQMTVRGYVRIIVLKGRQMGLSTYIGGRGYYRVTRKSGQKAYILAHELQATKNLFSMVKRFHDHMDPKFKPHIRKSNDQELDFDRLGGGYKVGTAKSGETGRSLTVQFFHGSEVAFWQAAKQIAAGLMQAVGTIAGTEVWLESTANGVGNFFHSAVQMARKKLTDFELAFCPWYWDPGYATPEEQVPEGFENELTLDDVQYQRAHELTLGQMHWRAKKIAEFASTEGGSTEAGAIKFAQEYPATPEEAFLGDAVGSFIRAIPVVLARKAYITAKERNGGIEPKGYGPKKLGIDPSHVGPDKFTIWRRTGRVASRVDSWSRQKITVSYGRCITIFEKEQPDEIYMDVGGVGGPLYDLLCETEWGDRIIPVLFGDPADEPERYFNKRCEMWGRTKDWLVESPQALLMDDDAIQADLTSVMPARDSTRNRTKLETKDDMKRRGMPSPDDGDALGLTFAYASAGTAGRHAPDPHRAVVYGSGMNVRGR